MQMQDIWKNKVNIGQIYVGIRKFRNDTYPVALKGGWSFTVRNNIITANTNIEI
jgi:hypothetical protein